MPVFLAPRAGLGDVVGLRRVECLVYFGQPIHELTDGLESLWEQALGMAAALLDAVLNSPDRAGHVETVLDEDRVGGYKLFALRWTVTVEG